jgi:sec-independent protein translocase protein TatA
MLPNLGGQELFIILFLALLIFGAKRLPEVGAGLGKGIRSFKEALKSTDVKEDLEKLENKKTEATPSSPVEKSSSKEA